MALNPSYIYPARPMHLKGLNDDNLGIGVAIGNLPPNPNGWGGTDMQVTFVDVRDVDLTGFPNTELDKKVFTFLNNTELHFKTKIDNNVIYARFNIEYQGTEILSLGNWTPRKLDQVPLSLWGDLTDCKFYCAAYYYQPVENVTQASGIFFDVMIPGVRTREDPYAIISEADLHQVVNGNTAWVATDICWAPTLLPIAPPDYFRTGIGTWANPQSNPPYEFYIENLETFNTFMKTAGTGTGNKNIWDDDPDDPAGSGDPSGPGGGGGTYDPTSDPIDFPTLPTGGALTSGMIKGFVVGTSALVSMQGKLWDMSIFDIATQFQKLVNQPLDCLISLHCLPVLPTASSTPQHIKLGSFDTEVEGLPITSQYVVVDCGTLNVKEYYGSALDYGPFTKAEIFLPFIGLRNIEIEDLNRAVIAVKYYVDVLTGSCVAFIKCGQSVLYTFTGSCIQHIPATSQTSDLLHNTISALGPTAVGIATGNPASAAAGAIMGAVNTASSKNHVTRSGDMSGSAGMMGEYTPYIIFHRPAQSLAKNYNKFKGYPSNITYTLSSLTGYTEVVHVHLTGISGATESELNEIESLLKSGVII